MEADGPAAKRLCSRGGSSGTLAGATALAGGVSIFVPKNPHGSSRDPNLAANLGAVFFTHCVVPVITTPAKQCGWQTLPSALWNGGAATTGVQFVTEEWVVRSMAEQRWLLGAEGQYRPRPPAARATAAAAAEAEAALLRSSRLLRAHSPEPFEDAEPAADMFSLLNWNVWDDAGNSAARMAALWREVLRRDRPTFLLFQEMTFKHWAHLQAQPWFSSYHADFGLPPHPCRCFTVLLCRKDSVQNPQQRQVYRYEVNDTERGGWSFERDIKSLSCQVGGTPLLVSTTHVMHFGGGCQQIEEMKAELQKHPERNKLIAGDLNWHFDRKLRLPDEWLDVWEQQRPGEAGSTFDTSVCFPKGKKCGKGARLDRVLARLEDWEPAYIELVGQQPLAEGVWISDHLGLFARFQRRRRAKAPEPAAQHADHTCQLGSSLH
ncbi:hypothetical protein ABPG75_008732 [Micractinium tetrahymenae]